MKKKTLALLLSLAMLIAALPIGTVYYAAEPGTVGQADYYNGTYDYLVLDDGTIEITGFSTITDYIAIPAELDGLKVTVIGEKAFSDCKTIKRVVIPEGVTKIRSNAFYICSNLESLTIPNSVISIENNVINGTKLYSSQPNGLIYIDNWVIGYRGVGTNIESIELDPNTRGIAGMTFMGFTKLKTIELPNGLYEIANLTFSNCSSLETIKIPDSVKRIGTSAFGRCTSLTSIDIPEGVTSIGVYAFNYCTSLTSISIPSTLTSVSESAFENCTSLTSVTLPSALTDIKSHAFGYDYSINNGGYSKVDGFTITAPNGSAAEAYAITNGFLFVGKEEPTTEPSTAPEETEPSTEPDSTEPSTVPEETEPSTEPDSTEPSTEPQVTNPSSNSTTEPISIAPVVDLVASEVGIVGENLETGDFTRIYTVIRNNGNTDFSGELAINLAVAGNTLEAVNVKVNLPAGKSVVISSTKEWEADFGSWAIRADINYKHTIEESNYNNNGIKARISIAD